jgi:DNA-binding NarL/FixJ family response regulator
LPKPFVQVLVIDDHLTVRDGLGLLLERAGLSVSGAGTIAEARELLERRSWDVALLDVAPRRPEGLALARELLAAAPGPRLVLTTACTDPASVLAAALALGAPGFVLKCSPPETLVQGLVTVASGATFTDLGLQDLLASDPSAARLAALTPRERQVLALLADGCSGPEIAERLFLSVETVRTHVANATVKLGARTRVQAVALLVRGGYDRLPDAPE